MIINIIAVSLVNEDVRAIIPVWLMPFVTAAIAVFNVIMQVLPRLADRPVRLNIAPGDSKPVAVKKLD